MTEPTDPALDLTISRVIHAPRDAVWSAWTEPQQFERWWLPAPTLCRVVAMELSPGGSFQTLMSDDGDDWVPHLRAAFSPSSPAKG